VKILSWYDNEWSFACRLVDLIKFICNNKNNLVDLIKFICNNKNNLSKKIS
jgi:hypothetical protein